MQKTRIRIRIRVFCMRSLLVLLCALGFFLTVFPEGHAFTRSALLLPDLLSVSQSGPSSWSNEPIAHSQLTAHSLGGTIHLDVYAPVTAVPLLARVRSGILVIAGVGDNRQDPQLVNLLESLAHTGLVVMSMTTPSLSAYTLSINDVDSTVQAFKILGHLPGMAGKPIGIISISGGVGLACLAAADPRIADAVSYVVAFGGYFSVKSLLYTFGRRAQDLDGKTVRFQPIDVPVQVLANTTGQYLASDERSTITNAFLDGAQPLTPAEIAHLSPGAQAIYTLLAGTDPGDADANIAKLPASMQAQFDELSPSRVIGQIRAPIFLMHDVDDPSLPVSETRMFAAALARIHHPYRYVEFHIFDHVSVDSNLNGAQLLGDGSRLFTLLNTVLAFNS
jgi:pimeloyl-ACP methyl ester carboxylesterase